MSKYYSLVTNDDQTADLYIFGDIVDSWETGLNELWEADFGEVSGLSIAKDLQGVKADTIRVHINSCGGYTAEGMAIYNLLRSHPAKVVTYCEGFACSAASLVFMAGDERVMRSSSLLMIHNAWSMTVGNAEQMREFADTLEVISAAAAAAYREHVMLTDDELDELLDGPSHEGTWITPAEAVEWGFATSIEEAPRSSSAMRAIMSRMASKELPPVKIGVELDSDETEASLERMSARIELMAKATDELVEKIRQLNELQGDPGVPPDNKGTFFEKLTTAFVKE